MRHASRCLAIASVVLSAALVSPVLATPATAGSAAEAGWSKVATRQAADHLVLERRAALVAAEATSRGAYRSYAGEPSLKACYGTERTSPVDGTPLDAATYGAYHGCISDGAWLFRIGTHSDFAPSDLRAMDFVADTDGSASTGCGGYEYDVFGFWSSEQQKLLAGVFSTPDCETDNLLALADLQAPNSREIGLQFTHASIGGGSAVRWYGEIRANADTATEFVPPTGDHVETGFGTSPAPAPTGADGCPTSGNAWYAATSDRDAVDDLRDAGLDDVRRLRGGLVAFRGDRSDAQAALGGVAVQRDLVRRLHTLPSDPGLGAQWGLGAVRAQQAWDLGRGSRDVVVAVIDSGVDATHVDLQGQLLPGYDAANATPLSSGNSDDVGHGTATAGVVAAATDNGSGLASLGWNTRVLPIKVEDAAGNIRVSALVAAIRYAADAGAAVVNMSLGSCQPSDAELAAVKYAQGKGVLVVASAGNEALQGNPVEYPAAYPGVLAVGATGRDGSRAFYSNTGSYVDLVAPGGSGNRGAENDVVMLRAGGGTFTAAGTSFSAPLVAAAAALVKAARPGLSGVALGEALTGTARDTGDPGRDDAHGAGTLDAEAALRAALSTAAPAPEAPTATPATTPPATTAPPATAEPTAAPTTAAPTTAAPTAAATVEVTALAPADAAVPAVTVSTRTLIIGQSVTLQVRTTPGALVDLHAYSRPSTAYARIRTGRADSNGLVSFAVAPRTNSRLYATATSRSGRAVPSSSVPLTVAAKVSTPVPARTTRLTYRFTGSVQPARAGVPVSLYSRGSNGALTRLATARTSAGGRWALDRRFLRATTVVVVARTAADTTSGTGASAARRVALR